MSKTTKEKGFQMAIRTYSTATANCLMTDVAGIVSGSMALETSANENTSEPWKKRVPSMGKFLYFFQSERVKKNYDSTNHNLLRLDHRQWLRKL